MTTAFHLKYRPKTLSRLIGHSQAVSQMQGMIKSGKYPNAIFLAGPSSAGKTTLARAFAAEVNGVKDVSELQGSYMEVNAANQRTLEDMRELIRVSKFRPTHKRRVICIDEAQQLLGSPAAAQSILKPLEEPASTTTWIICTMEPQKFQSGAGKAIINRCQQFSLTPASVEDLVLYGKRIAKRESMDYIGSKTLTLLAERANSEFRTMAQLLQSVYQHVQANGSKNLQKQLPSVLSAIDSGDDDLAIQIMLGIYTQSYTQAIRALVNVKDHFKLTNTMLWCAEYVMNMAILEDTKNPALKHWARVNREVYQGLKKQKLKLSQLAAVNEAMVNLRVEASTFAVEPNALIAARLFRTIKSIQEK